MRILVVSCGGIAAERPVHWFVEAGHEVCLLGDGDFYPTNPPPNYRYVPTVWRTEINANPASKPDETWMAQEMAPKIRWLVEEFQADLIHVHAIGWHSYSCALAGVRPLVVAAWGFLNYLLEESINEAQHQQQTYVLDRTDLLIVENPQLLEKTKGLFSPALRIELIPLGTNTQMFRRGVTPDIGKFKRDILHLAEDTTIILSPRGWSKIYGHEDIFQAYTLAYPQFAKATALVFLSMGRSPQEESVAIRDRIYNQAKTLNLLDLVHWLPHFPYRWMPTIYNLADVVVNYPVTDAFPSTLMEAVACECPVISCDLSAYRGTFIAEFCTLTKPQNPMALAETLIAVVNQPPEQRRDRLMQARQSIVEQFDENHLKQRFLQACETVVKQKVLN